METNELEVCKQTGSVSPSKSIVVGESPKTDDDKKVTQKSRVTFCIDPGEEPYGNEKNELNVISKDYKLPETDLPISSTFKRRVSVLMQDKETWKEAVNESKKNNKAFGPVAEHLLKKSSVYAVSQVGHAESFHSKILWIIVLLVGLFGCGYEVYRFLNLYLQYPVVINLLEENNQNLEFPAVTICNLNRLRKKYEICMDHNVAEPECFVSQNSRIQTTASSSRRRAANCSYTPQVKNKKIDFMTKYSHLTFEQRKFFGHQIDDFINMCSFDGVPCSLDHFSYFQSLKYGNCFTFNKQTSSNNTVLKTSSVGFMNGLDLVLNLEPENYMPSTTSIGARISVHDSKEDPNPEEEGVDINPGYETTVSMKQNCISRLPAPYKDQCLWYGKDNVRSNSKNECVKTCIQEQNNARCSCLDPTLPSLNGCEYCNMSDANDICCLEQTLELMAANGLPCKCPLSCFSVTYDLQISTAVWPTSSSNYDSYCDWCTNRNEHQTSHLNQSRVKIYYTSLVRKIFEQKPMFQDSELFSYLGGQMGLWLGLSLVAAFELIESFMYLCKHCANLTYSSKTE